MKHFELKEKALQKKSVKAAYDVSISNYHAVFYAKPVGCHRRQNYATTMYNWTINTFLHIIRNTKTNTETT